MLKRREEGQATVLVMLAMSIFLLGAVGLATDGSHLYAQRQMAQAAADAAAQAGIMSIFDGTQMTTFNPGDSFQCTTTDTKSPCAYARLNGFGGTTSDTVTVDFPTSAPGVTLSGSDPVNLLRATVQRNVDMTFIRLLGPSALPIKATATAAIVDVVAPVPIIVTHPTLPGALSVSGTGAVAKIRICGGPSRSVQVNSGSDTSIQGNGNPVVDLSHAGPNDPGNCTVAGGADFGNFGGPPLATIPFSLNAGTGRYIEKASPILDPLSDVAPPTAPTAAPTPTSLGNGVSGCPAAPAKPCFLYSPGLWTADIDVKNQTAVFAPGIYYMNGVNFKNDSNGLMLMATGITDGATGTNTGWTGNMLVYMTGSGSPAGTGAITVVSNSSATLVGSPAGSPYKGILFFVDRNAATQTHSLDGGGGLSLTGTLYMTDSLSRMNEVPSKYQILSFQGNPGSSTFIQGEIIASALSLSGNPGITMNLNPNATFHVRQVALIH
jgi:hypothetical protein